MGVLRHPRVSFKCVCALALDPLAHPGPGSYADLFLQQIYTNTLNRDIVLLPSEGAPAGTLFARDDVHGGEPCQTCGVLLWAQAEGKRLPLIVTRDSATLLNLYANNDAVTTLAFQAFYGFPMRRSILYGEGHDSQRLETSPGGQVRENHLSRGSVDLGIGLPNRPAWLTLPPDIPENEFRFVFGLDSEKIDGMRH